MRQIGLVMRWICRGLLLWSLVSGSAFADDRDKELRNPLGIKAPRQDQLVTESRKQITNRKAASLVKQQYNSSRILGISLIENNGPPIYRVRTLSPDGVVKSVFVDGESGEVFE